MPPCQRFTRRPTSRTRLNRFSIRLVDDSRIEVSEGDPESQVCVQTLFSHAGYPPCWRTKNEKWIDVPVLLK
jgi:hypothetical protein